MVSEHFWIITIMIIVRIISDPFFVVIEVELILFSDLFGLRYHR